MGTAYSIEEIEQSVRVLKEDVQKFDYSISSKRYRRLQKKLIFKKAQILDFKDSSESMQDKCDQLRDEINKCLIILTNKATVKNDTHNENEMEEELDLIKQRRNNDAETIIAKMEKDIPYTELEIENALESQHVGKRNLLEAELKVYFKTLALVQTDRNTVLDNRKNEIFRRLVDSYKKIIKDSGNFNSWVQKTEALATSYELDSSSSLSDFGLPDYEYIIERRSTPPVPSLNQVDRGENVPRVPTRRNREIQNNGVIRSQTNLVENTENTTEYKLLPYEKINLIRSHLIEIKDNIDKFDGTFNVDQYIKVRNDLLKYLDDLETIDHQGEESVNADKQIYIKYVDDLLDYLKQKSDLKNIGDAHQMLTRVLDFPKNNLLVSERSLISNERNLVHQCIPMNTLNKNKTIHSSMARNSIASRTACLPVVKEGIPKSSPPVPDKTTRCKGSLQKRDFESIVNAKGIIHSPVHNNFISSRKTCSTIVEQDFPLPSPPIPERSFTRKKVSSLNKNDSMNGISNSLVDSDSIFWRKACPPAIKEDFPKRWSPVIEDLKEAIFLNKSDSTNVLDRNEFIHSQTIRNSILSRKSNLPIVEESFSNFYKYKPPVPEKPLIHKEPNVLHKSLSTHGTNGISRSPVVNNKTSPRKIYPPIVKEDISLNSKLQSDEEKLKFPPPLFNTSTNNIGNRVSYYSREKITNLTSLYNKPQKNEERRIYPPIVKEDDLDSLSSHSNEDFNRMENEPVKSTQQEENQKSPDTEDISSSKISKTLQQYQTHTETDLQNHTKEAINEMGMSEVKNSYLLKQLTFTDDNYLQGGVNMYNYNENDENHVQKLKDIVIEVEKLEVFYEFFKKANNKNSAIYSKLQDMLMGVMRNMVQIDVNALDEQNKSLYETISKDIEKIVRHT